MMPFGLVEFGRSNALAENGFTEMCQAARLKAF